MKFNRLSAANYHAKKAIAKLLNSKYQTHVFNWSDVKFSPKNALEPLVLRRTGDKIVVQWEYHKRKMGGAIVIYKINGEQVLTHEVQEN